jgi:eukaryotic-like serine/threonine-protein kinase
VKPEEWEIAKSLFETALNVPKGERARVIHAMANGNLSIELKVNELLAADELTNHFLSAPANALLSRQNFEVMQSSLSPGDVLSSRFRIVRFVDRGGMGEVFEAWDSELRETVAIKTIRPDIACSAEILEQFKAEVKEARAISHPNISRVYDLFFHEQESGEKLWFLAMEFISGPTLRQYLRSSQPLSPKKSFVLIEQLISGLAAAHELGIVHRDFKCGNIMLVDPDTDHTRVVITDFGLALRVGRVLNPEDVALRGTPDYMAPEQLEGQDITVAVDQFALGIVICEMLTGVRPSTSDQPQAQHARQLLLSQPRVPRRWRNAICRTLQTNPDDRFTSVRDVLSELRPKRISKLTLLSASAVALSFIGSATYIGFREREKSVTEVSGLIQLTPSTDLSDSPNISRDGKLIVYASDRGNSGNMNIWVQKLPDGSPLRLTSDPENSTDPSISPDGKVVAFRSERKGGGIYLVPADGGDEILFASGGRNPRFSPDGKSILYWTGDEDFTSATGRIYRRDLANGETVRLATQLGDAREPVWSSNGRYVLFSGCTDSRSPAPACSEWWVISADGSKMDRIGCLDLLRNQGIQPQQTLGGWYGDKVLFSGRQGTVTSIWELSLAEEAPRTCTEPLKLTSGEARDISPSLADTGTIALAHLSGALHIWRIDRNPMTGKTTEVQITADAGVDICPFVSQNGRWLVFSRGFGTLRSIWLKNLVTSEEEKLPIPDMESLSPIVDDSGKQVVFEAWEHNSPSLYLYRVGEPIKKICTNCSKPAAWFENGHQIVHQAGMRSRIKLLDLDSGIDQDLLNDSKSSLKEPSWSSENQALTFTALDQAGAKRVFIALFSGHAPLPKEQWIPVTGLSEAGDKPRWSSDGRTLYYLSTRDGFLCLWGRHFNSKRKVVGIPFAVRHYHNLRRSPANVVPRSLNLSLAGDSLYLNLGESASSVWTGSLSRSSFASRIP